MQYSDNDLYKHQFGKLQTIEDGHLVIYTEYYLQS